MDVRAGVAVWRSRPGTRRLVAAGCRTVRSISDGQAGKRQGSCVRNLYGGPVVERRSAPRWLKWKENQCLSVEPRKSYDRTETATARKIERHHLVLSHAVEEAVCTEAQPAWFAKRREPLGG